VENRKIGGGKEGKIKVQKTRKEWVKFLEITPTSEGGRAQSVTR